MKAERLLRHVSEAATDVLSWYDAPIYLVYLINTYDFLPSDVKPIVLTPSSAEQDFARTVGISGSSSPGALEPFTIPHFILGARVLHAVGSELLSDDADMRPALRHSLGMYKALVYTQVSTQVVKNLVHRVRPDNSDNKSFFSGHTSTTFAMAGYLQRELDEALRGWDAISHNGLLLNGLRVAAFSLTYGWAGYVGYSRMRDNRHYLGDVIIGALIGTLIGNLIYDEIAREDGSLMSNISLTSGSDGPQFSLQLHF
ncbi:MAG: phosphatase PAP2 family protein [Bacteroidota bacterium]|nr:phosphatase PAP2 family protein [Bacteroidota bacterium]